MDQATQQNAALVEESAASSEAMKNEASDLLNLVSQFIVENNCDEQDNKHNINKQSKSTQSKRAHKNGIINESFNGFEKF